MSKLSRRAFMAVSSASAIGGMAVLVSTGLMMTSSKAQAEPLVYDGDTKFAIDGTDPVAYFTQGKPVKGSKQFTHEWNGSTWAFASEEHKQLFVANPEKYAPQFGGYCAFAAASGYTAPTVPEAWEIVDDKLYLNYSMGVQRRWQADRDGMIERGHANWPKIKAELQ